WLCHFDKEFQRYLVILSSGPGLPLDVGTRLSLTKLPKNDLYPLAYPVSTFTLLKKPSA
ncbi:hypothetical protein K443DRAFT_40681, partial [Laccaria amethystina LaAM-08-1]